MPNRPEAAEPPAGLAALDGAVACTDVAKRRRAALTLGQDHSPHGIVLLYLLAHDADSDVQHSALAATLDRCNQETPMTCAGMMRFFVGEESDNDTHWAARDWLLLDDPQSATQGATLGYKLDVVTRMAEQASHPGLSHGALRVLRLLAEDPEPEVQEAAAAVLLRANL